MKSFSISILATPNPIPTFLIALLSLLLIAYFLTQVGLLLYSICKIRDESLHQRAVRLMILWPYALTLGFSRFKPEKWLEYKEGGKHKKGSNSSAQGSGQVEPEMDPTSNGAATEYTTPTIIESSRHLTEAQYKKAFHLLAPHAVKVIRELESDREVLDAVIKDWLTREQPEGHQVLGDGGEENEDRLGKQLYEDCGDSGV